MTSHQAAQTSLSIVSIVFLLTGCQARSINPIVGKWQLTQTIGGDTMTVTREFKADGTETMAGPSAGAMNAEMTYTVAGNTLNETVTSMTIDSKTIGTDPSQMSANGPKYVTESFTLNGNTLTISNAMNGIQTTQTYDRATSQ
jgi:hypothetical protein